MNTEDAKIMETFHRKALLSKQRQCIQQKERELKFYWRPLSYANKNTNVELNKTKCAMHKTKDNWEENTLDWTLS
ncbi:hypothetical protein Bhyg_09361 [Pseudolycoriella hygida]|uniref:Uncharacterized protein n=1 Tax=Pseudolycoriella hygida TaxID=35572 RepID=A0A9Q0N6C0_9DIPT|nr:hypothetical protein Bhyg_09361 [Pseudolycoriella hygida]